MNLLKKKEIGRILAILLTLTMLSGCGKDSEVTETSDTTEETTVTASETDTEKATEVAVATETEPIADDDYTKQGIWSIEYEDDTTAKLILYNDGTGYYTSVLELCNVEWKYYKNSEKIQITFIDNDNYKGTYSVKETSSGIEMENDRGFVYKFEGTDLSEADKILEEDAIARGDYEEKVDGASIVKEDKKEEKIFDTPKVAYDDDNFTIEINSLYVQYGASGNVLEAGYDFNVINKSSHNLWIMFSDHYIGDTKVDMSTSPVSNSWNNPLLSGKRSDGNIFCGEEIEVKGVEDLDQLSGTAHVYLNDSTNSVGSEDISYNITFKLSEE